MEKNTFDYSESKEDVDEMLRMTLGEILEVQRREMDKTNDSSGKTGDDYACVVFHYRPLLDDGILVGGAITGGALGEGLPPEFRTLSNLMILNYSDYFKALTDATIAKNREERSSL